MARDNFNAAGGTVVEPAGINLKSTAADVIKNLAESAKKAAGKKPAAGLAAKAQVGPVKPAEKADGNTPPAAPARRGRPPKGD